MSLMPGFLRKKAKQAVQEPPPLPSKSFPVSVKADVAPPPLFARFATTTQAQATNGGAPGPPKVVSAPMSLQSGKSQKRSSLSSTPSTSSRTTTATQRNGARMPIPVTEKPLPPPSPYSEPPPPDPRQRHVSAPSSRAPQAVPPSVPIGQLSAGVRSRVSDVSPPASDPPPATKSSMKRPDTSQGTYIAESNAKTSAKRGSFSTPARPVPNDIASTPPASFGRQHGQSEQKQRRMNSQDLWGNSSGAPLSAGSSPAYPTGAAIQYGATVLQTNGHARDTSSLLVDLPPEVSLFHVSPLVFKLLLHALHGAGDGVPTFCATHDSRAAVIRRTVHSPSGVEVNPSSFVLDRNLLRSLVSSTPRKSLLCPCRSSVKLIDFGF